MPGNIEKHDKGTRSKLCITFIWYTISCLPEIFRKIATKKFLIGQNLELMDHLQDSAVYEVRGQQFSTPDDAIDVLQRQILKFPQSEPKSSSKMK